MPNHSCVASAPLTSEGSLLTQTPAAHAAGPRCRRDFMAKAHRREGCGRSPLPSHLWHAPDATSTATGSSHRRSEFVAGLAAEFRSTSAAAAARTRRAVALGRPMATPADGAGAPETPAVAANAAASTLLEPTVSRLSPTSLSPPVAPLPRLSPLIVLPRHARPGISPRRPTLHGRSLARVPPSPSGSSRMSPVSPSLRGLTVLAPPHGPSGGPPVRERRGNPPRRRRPAAPAPVAPLSLPRGCAAPGKNSPSPGGRLLAPSCVHKPSLVSKPLSVLCTCCRAGQPLGGDSPLMGGGLPVSASLLPLAWDRAQRGGVLPARAEHLPSGRSTPVSLQCVPFLRRPRARTAAQKGAGQPPLPVTTRASRPPQSQGGAVGTSRRPASSEIRCTSNTQWDRFFRTSSHHKLGNRKEDLSRHKCAMGLSRRWVCSIALVVRTHRIHDQEQDPPGGSSEGSKTGHPAPPALSRSREPPRPGVRCASAASARYWRPCASAAPALP